jgi:hypothetical protein
MSRGPADQVALQQRQQEEFRRREDQWAEQVGSQIDQYLQRCLAPWQKAIENWSRTVTDLQTRTVALENSAVHDPAHAKEFFDAVDGYLKRSVAPVIAKITELQNRIDAIEKGAGTEIATKLAAGYCDKEIAKIALQLKELEFRPLDLAGISFIQSGEDPRDATIKVEGKTSTKEFPFKLPGFYFRGVFRETEVYEFGDTSIWGGSLWVAGRQTSAKPGSENSGWTLCTKAGARGKDATGWEDKVDALARRIDSLERAEKAARGERKAQGGPRDYGFEALRGVRDSKGIRSWRADDNE